MYSPFQVIPPPGTPPLMVQTWGELLFLHFRVPREDLARTLPPGLELDLFEGEAWITVAPFTMWGIRPPALPPLPFLSRTH